MRNSNLVRKIYLSIVIRLIRKYFSEGVSVVTDSEENIIAYKWSWSKQVEDEVNGR